MSRQACLGFLRPRALLALIAGYLVWSLCFVLLYSLLSIGCEVGWHRPSLLGLNLLSWLLLLTWILHMGAGAWLIWQARNSDPPPSHTTAHFIRRVTLLLHTTALGGTIWIGLPILALPPCV